MLKHGQSDYDPYDQGRTVNSEVEIGDIRRQGVPEILELQDGGSVSDGYGCTSELRTMLETVAVNSLRQGKAVGMHSKTDGRLPVARMKLPNGSTLVEMARDIYPEYIGNRAALNAYLLRSGACYTEAESMRKNHQTGIVTPSKTKRLLTTNLDVVRSWTGDEGIKPAVASKLSDVDDIIEPVLKDDSGWGDEEEYENTAIPVVELKSDRTGVRKVVNSRKLYPVSSRDEIMPLYVYRAMVNEIYSQAADKIVRVSYRRTSGELREMDITFNHELISEIYGEETATSVLQNCYDGNFDGCNTVYSGYVRVPSIGESRFDGIERSLNFASLFNMETVNVEPDLTYVNIEIGKVLSMFNHSMLSLVNTGRSSEYQLVGEALREEKLVDVAIPSDPDSLEGWLVRKDAIEGTAFRKRLASFMLTSPEWFPDFTFREGDGPLQGYADDDDSVGML